MAEKGIDLLKATTEKMRWHEARQKVLAKNIANADTPNYTPQDIKELDFKEMVSDTSSTTLVTPTITDAKHISSPTASGSSGNFKISEQRDTYETSPTGNSVDLEEQLMKMSENQLDHKLTTTIYKKTMDALKKSVQSK